MLRLLILKITRRPVLTPPIPEREFDPSTIPLQSASSSPTLAPSSPPRSPLATPEHLKNNHLSLDSTSHYLSKTSALSSEAPVEEILLSKPLFVSSVKTPTSLIRELGSPTDWVPEVIFVLRPLIYGMQCITCIDALTNKPISYDAE